MNMLSDYKNNINWLAQCKRRMHYPVDRSDRAGLTAFEYGWKSFNNLYSEFKSGKDREKMRLCVEKYVDAEDFFIKNRKSINGFCNIHHRIYMKDDQYADLAPKIEIQVAQLRESIEKEEFKIAIDNLLSCLYTVRNSRVHGSFGTGTTSFSFLPKSVYELNLTILESKTHTSRVELEEKVDEIISRLTPT